MAYIDALKNLLKKAQREKDTEREMVLLELIKQEQELLTK